MLNIIRTPESALGQAAMQYAQDGYRVLPCRPHTKVPAIKDWPRRATSDLSQVSDWWSADPDRNIGAVTGAPGPDVLDIDVRPGGDGHDFLEELRDVGLLDGAKRIVRTPTGGEHWHFLGTSRHKTTLAPYVDFQAVGGYVLMPPSVIEVDGERREYRLEAEMSTSPGPLEWERHAAIKRDQRRANAARRIAAERNMRGAARWLSQATEGERNSRLFRAACWRLRCGRDPWALQPVAEALGLPPAEVADTIRSAIKNVHGGTR